jgi:RNA polymerase sigma factor (sigma-70 family)
MLEAALDLPDRKDPDARTTVAAAAGGDPAAFARLVEHYGKTVCSIALAIVGDVTASEDVAQEVFLLAWRRLPTLRNPASFAPWLRQLARNAARTHMRGTSRRRRIGEKASAELGREAAAAADPAPDAPTALAWEEERAALAAAIGAALAELPEDAREVVILFYREGRSLAQVAALLGLSQDAAKKRLSRARARLRADLADRLGDALERTAPGGAFAAALAGALAASVPANASAASAGGRYAAAGVKGAASTSAALAKVSAATAAGTLGAAAGLLGVLVGFRHYERLARDDEERRGIRRMAFWNAAAVLAVSLAVAGMSLRGDVVAGDLAMAVFLAIMGWINLVWLPRHVIGRRLALDRAADPIGAPRRQRRERILGVAGLCAGEIVVLVSAAWRLLAR